MFRQKINFRWLAAMMAAIVISFASCEEEDPTDADSGVLTINQKPSGGVTVQVYPYSGAAPASVEEFYQIYAQHLSADKAVATGVSNSAQVELVSLNASDLGGAFGSNSLHTVLVILSGTDGQQDESSFYWQVQFTGGCATIDYLFTGGIPAVTEKPAAVVNFTATAGDKQVSLAWDAPANDGGSAITGYEVTMNNWANKVTKTASERSHIYTGLTNGTEYTFKVRAVNAKGAGAESEKKATPNDDEEPNDDTEWSLPDNLRIKVQYERDGDIRENVVTKIGDNYFCVHYFNGEYSSEHLMIYDAGAERWTWWHRPSPTFNWSKMTPFTYYYDLESLYVRLTGADWMHRVLPTVDYWIWDVIRTDTHLDRKVNVRGSSSVEYWMDDVYNVCLKMDWNSQEIHMEVTEWDETVEDFDDIDFPEEE